MQIEIKNLIGIQSLSIETGKAALICGDNGAGKSSVAAAIRMALIGSVERVTLKKDASALARHGAKDYGVKLTIGESEYSFGKAFGKDKHYSADPRILGIVTGASSMAEMSAIDRMSILLELSGLSLTPDDIGRRLSQYDKDKVKALIPEIAKSWDKAESLASKEATGSRALWKNTTGESYGEVKAKTWTAEKPETNPARISELATEIELLDSQVKQLETQKTEAGVTNAAILKKMESLKTHQAIAEKLREHEGLLAGAEKSLADHKAEIAKVEVLASGEPAPAKYPCGCCNADLMWKDGKLLPWAHEGKAPDPEAKAALKRLIESQPIREQQVARWKKAVDDSKASRAIADSLELELEGAEVIDIPTISSKIAEKYDIRNQMISEANVLVAAGNAASIADHRTQEAAKHHANVQEWEALAKEMSATGLRQRLADSAITGFNNEMARFLFPEMPEIRVTSSDVTYSGRTYNLLSESEKWMVNAALSITVAIMSGLKFAVIDRLDVLHVARRSPVFKMISNLAATGAIDWIVIAATLKDKPKFPAPFSVFWLEDGVVVDDEQLKAA